MCKINNIKIGDIVRAKEGKLLVVTEMNEYKVKQLENLEDYISDVVVVKHRDQYKRVKEIINDCCDEYIMNNKVINFDESNFQ